MRKYDSLVAPDDFDEPTKPARRVPTVLLVGGGLKLVEIVRSAAVRAQLLVVACGARDAVDTALACRPLVIAVTQGVYRELPATFDDVARDTGARLFVLPEAMADEDAIAEELLRLTADAS